MLVPRSDPSVNAGAIHLQTLGDLTGGPPLDTEHDGLQAQNHPGRAIRLSFLPQSLSRWSVRELPRAKIGCMNLEHVVLLTGRPFQRIHRHLRKQKRHLPIQTPFLETHSEL